jgi:hypothetical protein
MPSSLPLWPAGAKDLFPGMKATGLNTKGGGRVAGSSLALCPLPSKAVAAQGSGPDSQAVSSQLDEAIALAGTFDLGQRAAHQGFKYL